MTASPFRARSLLSLTIAALSTVAIRADDPAPAVKDPKNFLPHRKYVELPGKKIGILAFDAQPVLSTEGRSGPPDQLVFSEGGNSYRWVYVPALEAPQITNLQVPVGPKGEINIYPALNMASPRNVTPWGIQTPFTLVEVSVNHEKGSPANDSFVGTNFKVLDDTKEYPLKTTEVIERLKKDYAEYQKSQAKTFDAAMEKVRQKAIMGKKASGPREQKDLMYVTWLSDDDILEVRFRTKISDGDYTFVEGGGFRPFELPPPPLPPIEGRPAPVPPRAIPVPDADMPIAFPPPPPPRFKMKVGTGFGIEYGQVYQVDKNGKTLRTIVLPVSDFVIDQRAVPGGFPRERPLPLPVPHLPPAPPAPPLD